ncbi:hypothetical protein F4778DRAFT_776854 [Xylariomycetidae sp. FL2044]|nr:hypothetical protein F4778DRAFT_776854 [Xylariomycetidae sp. FL2044]
MAAPSHPNAATVAIANTVASQPHAGTIGAPSHGDESLHFLRYFDTLFLIDDSTHMKRQWLDVSQLMQAIAPVCLRYDEDGIDMYFVNHRPTFYFPGISGVPKSGYNHIGKLHGEGSSKKDNAAGIFNSVKPGGGCKLGYRLNKILSWYIDQVKQDPKRAPLNVIVITAGVTDDDYHAVLADIAKQLDSIRAPEHQLGVQLFQIGDDEEAKKKFEHADDELHKKAGTRDMVDTMAWSGWPGSLSPDDMVKAVLGAVSKRMDKQQRRESFQPAPKHSAFDYD